MPDSSRPIHPGKPVPADAKLNPDEGFTVPADSDPEVTGREGSTACKCSVCGTICQIPDGYGWFICPNGHANYM